MNRWGTDHTDEQGSFSYYTWTASRSTAVDELTADYRIFEAWEETLVEHDPERELECPELDEETSEPPSKSSAITARTASVRRWERPVRWWEVMRHEQRYKQQ